jgi:hypothetical protein
MIKLINILSIIICITLYQPNCYAAWQKVNSSAVNAIDYKRSDNILLIKFNSGNIYAYYKVSFNVYKNFMNADSKGIFFNLYIKDKYVYKKIN